MNHVLSRRLVAFALACAVSGSMPAVGQAPAKVPEQPAPAASPGAARPSPAKGEAEFLASPGGGAFEVPIHVGSVCIFTFPEKLSPMGIASSASFEIMEWGADGIAVRATPKATTTTLAVATVSGSLKANLTIRVVPESEPAYTLVRLRVVTEEEAFQARLAAELEKKLAPLRAQLEAERAALEEGIRERAEAVLAERLLRRAEVVSLRAHERNAAAVIAHVQRAAIAGEDAYVFFEIENRSNAAYRLAKVSVIGPDGQDLAGVVRLTTGASKDPKVLGTVLAGTSARVIVAVRGAEQMKGKKLTLSLSEPDGRGRIDLTRKIELP